MIRLAKATIHRYKCFSTDRELETEPDITVLIGENDTGKTCVLEALAKANYINRDDGQFSYRRETDYPRAVKAGLEKTEQCPDAVTLEYRVSEELTAAITEEMLLPPEYPGFCRTTDFAGKHRVSRNGFSYDPKEFWSAAAVKNPRLKNHVGELSLIRDKEGLAQLARECANPQERAALEKTERFFENRMRWENPLSEYVYRTWLLPSIPRFLYYDEYYMLPSRVCLNRLAEKEELSPSEKTAKALLLLADVDVDSLLEEGETDLEHTRVVLEQMSREITRGFLNYWSTNQDLRIEFVLTGEKDGKGNSGPGQPARKSAGGGCAREQKRRKGFLKIFSLKEPEEEEKKEPAEELYLDIRVYDMKNMISLPVGSKSRGFNWFLSFYIWFMAMEKTVDGSCIFLLDEPGQNLHEVAQKDMMRLMQHLAQTHQVIFTTHSLAVISGEKWEVKTRCIKSTDTGADIINDIKNEKSNKTVVH